MSLLPFCRIGERVFLSSATVDSGAIAEIAAASVRQMEITAGKTTFRLHQVRPASDVTALFPTPSFESFLSQVAVDDRERMALLQSLFGMAMPMFQLADDPVFTALVAAFADRPDLPKATVQLEAVDGLESAVATVPARARLRPGDVLVSVANQKITLARIGVVRDFLVRENPRERIAAVAFSGPVAGGRFLLASDAGLVAVDLQLKRHTDLEAFHTAFARRNPDLLAVYAERDTEAGAVLDRLQRQSPPRPLLNDPLLSLQFHLENALPLSHGLFASGWFSDPEGWIESVTSVDHTLTTPQISSCWKIFDGVIDNRGKLSTIKRFVAFLPGERQVPMTAPVPVRLVLANGESHLLTATPTPHDLRSQRGRIVGTLTGQTLPAATLEQVYLPALAPLQSALNARISVCDVQEYGLRSTRATSLIIPLYRETGFLRSQLMAFSVDPEIRQSCEIVYVLDDPPLAADVASLLEGFVLTFPLDIKLVVLGRNGGYAAANNLGVSQADGETLVLMNSDVIPDRAGWVSQTAEKLRTLPPFSIIGPKLLFADGNLQHAGMYFHPLRNGQWQNFHFWKGYARHFPPADRERIVPAVTGACMILRKHDYLAVGGFTTDYVIGDYEDSDLCLKLRDNGGTPLYMPSVTLHHFERQSMPNSDDQDLGSTVYNRALHSWKWQQKILEANAAMEEN